MKELLIMTSSVKSFDKGVLLYLPIEYKIYKVILRLSLDLRGGVTDDNMLFDVDINLYRYYNKKENISFIDFLNQIVDELERYNFLTEL